MAASTGSPASRKSTKLTPLTTRPSLTSRQGITRTLNIAKNSYISAHDLFGKPDPTFPDHALGRRARVADQRQRGGRIEAAVIECAASDRTGEFLGARLKQRLHIVDGGKTARGDDGDRDA